MSHAPMAPQTDGPVRLVPDGIDGPKRLSIPMKAADEPPGFFDKPKNIRRMQYGYLAVMGLLIFSDLFLHYHEHLGMEFVPGFYTLFSLVACLVLFAAAKATAVFVKRGEDYYE